MTLFQDVTNQALDRIDEISVLASTWSDTTLAQMDALGTEASALLDILNGVLYDPDFGNLNLSYQSPGAPVEPDYSAQAPDDPLISVISAVADFDFTPTPYSELIRDEMLAVFVSVLGGNLVIPTSIWDSIWDRVLADFSMQQTAEEWQAQNLGASLGWELPSESTLNRLDKAQDETSKRVSLARLEKAIQEAVQRREDYWNAIQHGTPFENMWISEHNAKEDRLLRAESERVESQIKIQQLLLNENNVNVAIYLAKWDGILKEVSAAADMLRARTGAIAVQVDDEKARHGFENSKIEKGIRVADGETNLAIERARIIAANAIATLSKLAELAAGMAQAALSASDVSVGTSTSMASNEQLNINQDI